ncbi:site-specific integrase [Methylophilus sp. 13]|uniref:tyrosine-type recombinase/integrase n=1 Tax=Methylophilus sp. 13 TaxID=2781018 RepID=UPI00188DD629|nr:site-specific integrase [Methylophilus sp. 13]MBF5037958.1 site-specific integrase [Methylophilus sp. 13]
MKNVSKIETQLLGRASWRLIDSEGDPISSFDMYMKVINENAYPTKKRYGEVVSNLIDYFYEVGVLGKGSVSRKEIDDAIDYYLVLLRDGPALNFGLRRGDLIEYEDGYLELEQKLRQVALNLGITSIQPASWSNTLAALNGFIYMNSQLEMDMKEIAILKGKLDPSFVENAFIDPRPLFSAVTDSKTLSPYEIKKIKQNSVLGSVMRVKAKGLSRPAGLASKSIRYIQNGGIYDFPMEQLPNLLKAASCWRDKALWLLTAASGIRRSEALNLEWAHIDFEDRAVYVLDPHLTRHGRDLCKNEKANRFKGRDASWTYLIQPYKDFFFEALMEYRKQEYVLPKDGNDFVFQYINCQKVGQPYRSASDATLNSSFKRAVKRAGIKGPPLNEKYVWTQHSFRHAYGVFMLNDIVIPDQPNPGLTEVEVQMLMGHKSILTTRKYARPKLKNIKRKLELYDARTFGNAQNILPNKEK